MTRKNIHGALLDAAFDGDVDLVKALIAAGADVEAEGVLKDESTPLHFAAMNGHLEVCKVLVAAGACLLSTDNCSTTPRTYAVRCGHHEIRDWLDAAENAEDRGCFRSFMMAQLETAALAEAAPSSATQSAPLRSRSL